MDVERSDNRRWYQGPLFPYKAGKSDITVDVTLSSWPIRGLGLAKAVLSTIREFRKTATGRVLDFGSGSWLRYLDPIRRTLQAAEIHAVEFGEAFRGDAQEVRNAYDAHVKFWTPAEFAKKCSIMRKFGIARQGSVVLSLGRITEEIESHVAGRADRAVASSVPASSDTGIKILRARADKGGSLRTFKKRESPTDATLAPSGAQSRFLALRGG